MRIIESEAQYIAVQLHYWEIRQYHYGITHIEAPEGCTVKPEIRDALAENLAAQMATLKKEIEAYERAAGAGTAGTERGSGGQPGGAV